MSAHLYRTRESLCAFIPFCHRPGIIPPHPRFYSRLVPSRFRMSSPPGQSRDSLLFECHFVLRVFSFRPFPSRQTAVKSRFLKVHLRCSRIIDPLVLCRPPSAFRTRATFLSDQATESRSAEGETRRVRALALGAGIHSWVYKRLGPYTVARVL
jgi:hypothetical protein